MSDCVYVAWAAGAKDLGIKPKNGSRQFFEGARSFFGEAEGLWAGAAPLVVGLLCSAHNMTLTVDAHPWFDKAYYREAARSEWQNWAVASWTRRALWRELAAPRRLRLESGPGAIYFWLGGHHAYYATEPDPSHLVIMRIKLYRRKDTGVT